MGTANGCLFVFLRECVLKLPPRGGPHDSCFFWSTTSSGIMVASVKTARRCYRLNSLDKVFFHHVIDLTCPPKVQKFSAINRAMGWKILWSLRGVPMGKGFPAFCSGS